MLCNRYGFLGGEEYDNGVDNVLSPKHYLVWNMNVNTHVYPEFVVSFKLLSIPNAEGDFSFHIKKKVTISIKKKSTDDALNGIYNI